MTTPIGITGILVSDVEATDEQLVTLNRLLAEDGLADIAVATQNNPERTRIDFKYAGPRNLYMNPTNFSFAEKLARLAEAGEELNLSLVGTVIIHDIEDRWDGKAYMVTLKDGKATHRPGIINRSTGEITWQDKQTLVSVGPQYPESN